MPQANSTSPLPNSSAGEQNTIVFNRIPTEAITIPEEAAAVSQSSLPDLADCIMPVIVYVSDDRYLIVDGIKRFIAQQNAKRTEIDCGVITPTPDPLHAMLLRISLNRKRPFSLSEKLHLISGLAPWRDREFYREISRSVSANHAELQLLEQLTSCAPEIKDAVCGGTMELQIAPVIDHFTPEDRKATLGLFSSFPFSRQTQKEFSDWLPELAFRERTSVAALLAAPSVEEILQHPKLNAPQKIDKLRQVIHERRFPTIVKAKKRWTDLAASLNPDRKAVIMKPSDAFEKNRLELKITVTSGEQANMIFSRLGEVPAADWEKLIYPAQFSSNFQQSEE